MFGYPERDEIARALYTEIGRCTREGRLLLMTACDITFATEFPEILAPEGSAGTWLKDAMRFFHRAKSLQVLAVCVSNAITSEVALGVALLGGDPAFTSQMFDVWWVKNETENAKRDIADVLASDAIFGEEGRDLSADALVKWRSFSESEREKLVMEKTTPNRMLTRDIPYAETAHRYVRELYGTKERDDDDLGRGVRHERECVNITMDKNPHAPVDVYDSTTGTFRVGREW